MPSSRARSLWFRLVAIAIGFLLALAFGELAYRFVRLPGLSPVTHPDYVLHDAELGWSYRPNARHRHVTPEFDVEVMTNRDGYRGWEWPSELPGTSQRRRVLVLGDSFAFGWGVSWEHTFTARLALAHPEWDIRNAAVAGYGADQQLLVLKRLAPQFRPEVVVCVFCDNDLWESNSDEAYGRGKPQFELDGDALRLRVARVEQSWLQEHSALFAAVRKKLWESRFSRRERDTDSEWRMVEQIYRAMRDELGGSRLLVVSDMTRLATSLGNEVGILPIDCGGPLAAVGEPTRFAADGHWNERGHAAVAELLGPAIEGAFAALPAGTGESAIVPSTSPRTGGNGK
jgi:GDSL-like Lipase/Acylhydrolase family